MPSDRRGAPPQTERAGTQRDRGQDPADAGPDDGTVPARAFLFALALLPLTLLAVVLGLEAEHIVLLVLSLFMATVSLATGPKTSLPGGIHLVIFGAFLTPSAVP